MAWKERLSLNGIYWRLLSHQQWGRFQAHCDWLSVVDRHPCLTQDYCRIDDCWHERDSHLGRGCQPHHGRVPVSGGHSGRTGLWCGAWRGVRGRAHFGTTAVSSCGGLRQLHWRLAVGNVHTKKEGRTGAANIWHDTSVLNYWIICRDCVYVISWNNNSNFSNTPVTVSWTINLTSSKLKTM